MAGVEQTKKCPEGTVLINSGGNIHADEPAFCINKTEVPQAADRAYWAAQQQSGYELVVTKKDGNTTTERNVQERPLRTHAAARIQQNDVSGVQVKSVVVEDKPQPDGNRAGDKKAATLRNWKEAREFCQKTYPGGDLPTNKQWEKACGDKKYCTASGELNASEADYGRSYEQGPANVDVFPANANGVQGMTGGVWEWTKDDAGDGYKFIRGGSWGNNDEWGLRAGYRNYYRPDRRDGDVGFRCVVPPQDSKK